jgi:hypothetical protein
MFNFFISQSIEKEDKNYYALTALLFLIKKHNKLLKTMAMTMQLLASI